MTPEHLFGQILAATRVGQRLSQKALALDARLDQSHLSGIECGRRAPPSKPVLARLCNALHANDAELRTLSRALALTKLARELKADQDFVAAVMRFALRRDPSLCRDAGATHSREK